MSTTRYFTHVDKFCDGTAYIEVGDFGTRLVGTCGAREGNTQLSAFRWTLDECMGNCRAGVWRELSEADVLALNIPAAPVDPRDAEIARLTALLAEAREGLEMCERNDRSEPYGYAKKGAPEASYRRAGDGAIPEVGKRWNTPREIARAVLAKLGA